MQCASFVAFFPCSCPYLPSDSHNRVRVYTFCLIPCHSYGFHVTDFFSSLKKMYVFLSSSLFIRLHFSHSISLCLYVECVLRKMNEHIILHIIQMIQHRVRVLLHCNIHFFSFAVMYVLFLLHLFATVWVLSTFCTQQLLFQFQFSWFVSLFFLCSIFLNGVRWFEILYRYFWRSLYDFPFYSFDSSGICFLDFFHFSEQRKHSFFGTKCWR